MKVKLDKHRKTIAKGEVEKFGMACYIWKAKNHTTPSGINFR